MAIAIDHNIPITETRGRPPSDEHVNLMTMNVGDSFVSSKRREALYQLARHLGVKVTILVQEEDGLCRVWKKSNAVPRKSRRLKKVDKGA